MRSNYSLAHSPGYHHVGGGVSTPRHRGRRLDAPPSVLFETVIYKAKHQHISFVINIC